MGKIKDLKGMTFGRWTVLEFVKRENKATYWLCECSCENKTRKNISSNSLVEGNSKSCGCLKKESTIKYNKENKKKYNLYDLTGKYGIGYTSKGEEFYFDLEDYDKIKDYYWRFHNGYIHTEIEDKYISMHRFLLKPSSKEVIDHINRVKHDNRKDNLKVCQQQENMWNQEIRINNKSGVTGVTWDKWKEKWQAYISINGKNKHLGFFINKEDAIIVRLKAEKKYNYSGKNKELWETYNI